MALYYTHLKGIGHHGDEHVQEHNNVTDAVGAKHEEGPKSGELFDPSQFEISQRDETKGGPKEGLRSLKEVSKPTPNDTGIAL